MKKIYNRVKDFNNRKNIYKYVSLEEDLEFMTNARLESAEKRGIERGIEQGIEQGYDLGYSSGILETKNKMVMSLLEQNIPINVISNVTGLDCSYIEKLPYV